MNAEIKFRPFFVLWFVPRCHIRQLLLVFTSNELLVLIDSNERFVGTIDKQGSIFDQLCVGNLLIRKLKRTGSVVDAPPHVYQGSTVSADMSLGRWLSLQLTADKQFKHSDYLFQVESHE